MQIAVDGAWDVALVVDAPVRRDVDEPEIGVVEVVGQPVHADQPAGIGGVARFGVSGPAIAADASRRYGAPGTLRRRQRWRTLVLLYPVLDARYGPGGARAGARGS